MRYLPTLSKKGSEAKQDSNEVMVPIPPSYGRFYALQAKESKGSNPNEKAGKLLTYVAFVGFSLKWGNRC